MRKIIYSVILGITAYMISSCSSNPDYINVIPNDADAVFSIKVDQIVEKSGFYSNKDVQTTLLDALKSETNRSLYSLIENIASDINISGIDFTYPVYQVATNMDKSADFMFVAKLENKNKFEEMINLLVKEQLCGDICRDYEGFSYIIIGNEDGVLAYNDNSIIASAISSREGLTPKDILESKIVKLMKQSADKSLASNKVFSKMMSQSSDMSFFINYESILKSTGVTHKALSEEGSILENAYLIGGTSFNKGSISLVYEIYSENEKLNKQLDLISSFVPTIDGKFLSYISESVTTAAAFGFKGEAFIEAVNSADDYIDSDIKDFVNQLSEILPIFDGDVALSMTSTYGFTGFVSTANKESALKVLSLAEQKTGMKFKEVGNDCYSLSMGSYLSINFGLSGSDVFISNDISKGFDIFKKDKNPITDADLVTKTSDKMIFVYGDINSPIVKSAFSRELRRNPAIGYFMDEVKHVELSVDKNFKLETTIVLKNNSDNSLKVFTDSAAKLTRSFR